MLCPLNNYCHSVSGALADCCNASLTEPGLKQAQDLSVLGHEKTSLKMIRTVCVLSLYKGGAHARNGGSKAPEQWLSLAGLLVLKSRNIHGGTKFVRLN